MKKLRVGIDFDHTIVCYDDVFYKAALEQNLIPASISHSKTHIRDYFRSMQRENEWTRLQGYVYGARMDLARPFPGVDAFFSYCRKNQIKISIISHKTKYPYLGPQYDLHEEARKWLSKQPFFDPQIEIYFELTLQKKLERIAKAECAIFIDDLPELLKEPNFPRNVRKVLFDPSTLYEQNSEWLNVSSWDLMPSILRF